MRQSPYSLFWHVDSELAARFLIARHCSLDRNSWLTLGRRKRRDRAKGLILGLSEDHRAEVEADLADINLFEHVESTAWLLHGLKRMGDDKAASCIHDYSGHFDRAMLTLLKAPEAFKLAVKVAHAEVLRGSRWWNDRSDVRTAASVESDELRVKLRDEVRAFFIETDGRGDWCECDRQSFNGHLHYFFLSPSNHSDRRPEFSSRGQLVYRITTAPFSVVFAYDSKDGVLSTCAPGGSPIIRALDSIFGRVVLGQKLDVNAKPPPAFDLTPLLRDGFELRFKREDGVKRVSLRQLRVRMPGSKDIVTLESSNRNEPLAPIRVIDRYFDLQRVQKSRLTPLRAEFVVEFDEAFHGRRRSISFGVGMANRSTLRNTPAHVVAVVDSLLKLWELRVAH